MALSELTPLVERGYYGAQTSLDELQNKIADQNKLRESPPSPSASADITAGLGAYQSGDYATALRELTPLAKQGDARAQFSLGVMYEDGKGVPQDYKTAVKWYRLAAEQGDADAQFLLEYLERRIAQQKPSPTVTPPVIARKSPPLSPSAADKENENLRQRIAELEKQRQSPPKIDLKNRRELARRTQEALQVLGLYSGNMDGIIGVRTRHAIRGWQKRERYSATGEITETQIVKLEQEAIQHLANKKPKPQQVAKRPPPKPSPPKRSSTSVLQFKEVAKRPDDIAVIIANSNYKKQGKDIPNVDPAYNDAENIKRYFMEAKGIREGNILYLKDATGAQLAEVFGNRENHKATLFNWVKPNNSNVHIYYAGHGAPALKDGSAFLVPTDAKSQTIEFSGYRLADLYRNLGKIKARSITVILEACFSGFSQAGGLLPRSSGITIVAKTPKIPPNVKVISAGAANQMASWEKDDSESLFTKYFLKAMSGEGDKNKDGNVDDAELRNYLNGTMTYYARRYYGRDQKVQIVSGR